MQVLLEAVVLTCELGECLMIDCPCIGMARWFEQEWVERSAKAVQNVGDLWAFKRGLRYIAEREVARLNRKANRMIDERITLLERLLADCVASLAGYRRNHNDGQPCDAEKAAREYLGAMTDPQPEPESDPARNSGNGSW